MPEISIIMSVHGGGIDFLRESIESILAQSFSDFEFIIVDDEAKKEARDLIEKYAASDKRIRIIRNEKNLGLTRSLNVAIENSCGKFIARMDDDDVSLPSRLEDQLGWLRQNNFDLIGCDCDFINEKGKIIYKKRVKFPEDLKRVLFKGNFFTHSTFFGRRSVFQEFYDDRFKRSQDYEFLLRVVSKGYNVGYLSKTLLLYRVGKNNISAKNAKAQEWCAIKARWKAVREMGYKKSFSIYFFRAFVSFLIPFRIKYFIIYSILG
ncbi:MAG: glycosyltransferase [Candidatus Moranbacteria bacterium]|nr:glycosyltransferase [Candidatus Moranbacteria bacterium]